CSQLCPCDSPSAPLPGIGNGVSQMTFAPFSQEGRGAGWEVGENFLTVPDFVVKRLDEQGHRRCLRANHRCSPTLPRTTGRKEAKRVSAHAGFSDERRYF